MTPEQLEILRKYRISIPSSVKSKYLPAGDLFNFLHKNNGLTEEYIYNNANPLSPLQLPVYTASFEPIGYLPFDIQKEGVPLKICNGEVIIIFRQGYAGEMFIPNETMFFAYEHTIPIQVKDEYKKSLNQHWFTKYYQSEVMHYVTGKADSGNFSALAFERMGFLIPERWWQDECAKMYLELESQLLSVTKNISGLSVNKSKKNGLSDAELAAKYDTGEKVDFDGALKTMAKSPSKFALAKPPKAKR